MNTIEFNKNPNIDRIKNRPILDIAASFWEEDRYNAFITCYRSMRVIDDLVDDHKSLVVDNCDEVKRYYVKEIKRWIRSLVENVPYNSNQKELLETISEFQIPLWPWIDFTESMIFDLNNNGFKTFREFRKYSDGAAVSPGSIFMHLSGIHKTNGYFTAPHFDIKNAATPLALFSYLVHVIRDFQKDQKNNLNYIPDKLIDEYGLTRTTLKEIAAGGEIISNFRELMNKYYKIIEYYRSKSRNMLDTISDFMEPRYKISLEIIFSLYLQIFERIDLQKGSFTAKELNPSEDEISTRVDLILSEFQYEKGN